jgi:predicted alpha-1,2-mannosidase
MPRTACIVAFVLALAPAAAARDASRSTDPSPSTYVNPFSGTAADATDFGTGGGAGNTFPGPVRPFGMIQWGPDTSPSSLNVGGGYAYRDSKIRGFSVRRLSGAGCANGGDFPFLPTTGPVTSSPVKPLSTEFADASLPSFSHDQERAAPGYYRVALGPRTPERIDARLTATRRAGIARFRFPPKRSASVLVNATGSRNGAAAGTVRVDPARREVSGSASTGGFCLEPNRHKLYFVARFSRRFTAHGTWTRQALAPGSTSARDSSLTDPLAQGDAGPTGFTGYAPAALSTFGPFAFGGYGPTAQTGAYATFDAAADRSLELRVGISFVSVEGARRNLEAELGGRAFGSVKRAARRSWDRMLGRIEVEGGRVGDRRTFYSALYHALIAPSTFNDVDRRYAGMDGKVHRAKGHTQYADFSGWDVYRSQMPLLALIAPKRASDFATSLLANQRESGWLPQWSVANGHTEVMTGDPAAPTIASISALGAGDFDRRAALAAMIKGATRSDTSANAGYVERQAVEDYQRLGYVPHEKNANLVTVGVDSYRRVLPARTPNGIDLVWGSAGTTLEYATADFAVAQMAADLGDRASCRTFMRRSANWRNVFDSSIGYVRPRYSSGLFHSPYDPNSNDPLSSRGFAEGNGSQYTWMVPHDPAGLFQALGGKAAAAARLDRLFEQLNAGPDSPHAFLGNEPNSNAPWLYDWLGQPHRTQEIVRRAILTLFDATPGGYPGNDDLGQMSAWYVFGALGFYPQIPGTDVLALGSPLFPRATVHLRRGDLSIRAPQAARGAPFVERLRLDGKRWTRPWLRLRRVARDGRLAFDLGRKPERRWGSAASAAPPSFGPDDAAGCE